LRKKGARWEVINNGINPEAFLRDYPEAREMLHGRYDIDNRRFVFGFFGRFMPQKGFNYIIDAVENLSKTSSPGSFVVLAVSSGDFEREYKSEVARRGLNDWFHFGSFSPDVALLIQGCDAVLMPSIWEAWGLLACEVLCAGTPLIASTCIGMRGVIADTPAIDIPPHDPDALTEAMKDVMKRERECKVNQEYRQVAAERFHVRYTGTQLAALFREICENNKNH
jgi:glycosyltransferase involved in cell wall biosynthesis